MSQLVEKPKLGSIQYVVLASQLMFLLQVMPWPEGFMTGFFNGWDTRVYERHGTWILTGQVPYLELYQEYPPLQVLMTALPHLSPFGYRDSFIFMNHVLFLGLLFVYWRNVKHGELGVTSGSVLILGLPSVLYNISTFNDLWVAATVMLAFVLLHRGRSSMGIALLATGVFFKSYPLFLLPVAFCWLASQEMDDAASPMERVRGYLAALASRAGLRWVASAVLVAVVIGGAFTLWTGTSWLTVPAANYGHRNPESFVYLLTAFTPLDWPQATWLARALAAGTVLGAFLFVPLRRFDNAVRVAIVVVIAMSMSLPFHSPHWILWFVFLFCLIPVTRPLLLFLVVYDIDNLLYWPLFSFVTPIEVLLPLARQISLYPIVGQCVLKVVLIVWMLREARRVAAEARYALGSTSRSRP